LPEDRHRVLVVPVVEDLRQDVHIGAGEDVGEEVPADRLAAVAKSRSLDDRSRLGNHVGEVEDDAAEVGLGIQHSTEQ
jgi:hypothetical protein